MSGAALWAGLGAACLEAGQGQQELETLLGADSWDVGELVPRILSLFLRLGLFLLLTSIKPSSEGVFSTPGMPLVTGGAGCPAPGKSSGTGLVDDPAAGISSAIRGGDKTAAEAVLGRLVVDGCRSRRPLAGCLGPVVLDGTGVLAVNETCSSPLRVSSSSFAHTPLHLHCWKFNSKLLNTV